MQEIANRSVFDSQEGEKMDYQSIIGWKNVIINNHWMSII
jgi:hypothetical protein